ncbi:MAG: hypothetical protein AB1721_00065 [Patescibacteria group bacterium]
MKQFLIALVLFGFLGQSAYAGWFDQAGDFLLGQINQVERALAPEKIQELKQDLFKVESQEQRQQRQEIKQQIQEQRQELQQETQEQRKNLRLRVLEVKKQPLAQPLVPTEVRRELLNKKVQTQEEFLQKREEWRNQIQQRQEEFRAQIQENRAELKTYIEEKRVALKEQLQNIRDERKQAIVERIDQRIDELNQRMTNHFLAVLEKLETVLERIGSRADKAEANGLDVSAVRSAITEAEQAIAAARTAVAEQSGKTYLINITDEENLKADVGQARQALAEDLKAVREVIKSAHDAVRRAAVALAQIPRVDELEIETSPTPEPAD